MDHLENFLHSSTVSNNTVDPVSLLKLDAAPEAERIMPEQQAQQVVAMMAYHVNW